MKELINSLKSDVQVVVGTPGRVFEMISECYLRVKDLKFIVID